MVEEAEEGMRGLETIVEEEEEQLEMYEVEEEPRRRPQEEEMEELEGGREEDFSFEGFGGVEDAGEAEEQEDAREEEEGRNRMRGAAAREVGGRVVGGRVYVGKRSRCQHCGRELSHSNMARHERRCRLVWDPGGGPHPI